MGQSSGACGGGPVSISGASTATALVCRGCNYEVALVTPECNSAIAPSTHQGCAVLPAAVAAASGVLSL
jgi:hypothetical protein